MEKSGAEKTDSRQSVHKINGLGGGGGARSSARGGRGDSSKLPRCKPNYPTNTWKGTTDKKKTCDERKKNDDGYEGRNTLAQKRSKKGDGGQRGLRVERRRKEKTLVSPKGRVNQKKKPKSRAVREEGSVI